MKTIKRILGVATLMAVMAVGATEIFSPKDAAACFTYHYTCPGDRVSCQRVCTVYPDGTVCCPCGSQACNELP